MRKSIAAARAASGATLALARASARAAGMVPVPGHPGAPCRHPGRGGAG
jgi:hypothetical protein